MNQLTAVELMLAYVAGLLTIPAMLIIFILATDDTPHPSIRSR
jgi:hypothetical protein